MWRQNIQIGNTGRSIYSALQRFMLTRFIPAANVKEVGRAARRIRVFRVLF